MSGGATTYGLLGLDGMQLALPLTVLREVIPAPSRPDRLPAVADGLLGAVELRKKIIPVLDLGRALGWPPAADHGRVIAVAVHDGLVVGLLADGVRGITVVPGAQLQAMTAQDGTALAFSHAFERPEDGTLCSLLDVSALFRLPGLPALREAEPAAGTEADLAGSPARGVAMLTVRCGAYHLAVQAVAVHTVLPTVEVLPSPVVGGACRGVTRYRSVDVPAVDLSELLGLGRLTPSDSEQGVVLQLEHGLVALLLSQVIDIVSVPADLVLPLPPRTVPTPDLFAGVLPLPGGQHFVLDVPALFAVPTLIGLSGCNTGPGVGDRGVGDRGVGDRGVGDRGRRDGLAQDGYARAGGTYLTYYAGAPVATPLAQVDEIVPFDRARATLGTGQEPVLGVYVHRSRALPVVDLSALLGFGPSDPDRCSLLVVHVGAAPVGYLVGELRAIEPSVWEEEQDESLRSGTGPRGLAARPSLQLGDGADRRMVPRVDLHRLAADLLGVPADLLDGPADLLDGPADLLDGPAELVGAR